jgi:hypothetical protein
VLAEFRERSLAAIAVLQPTIPWWSIAIVAIPVASCSELDGHANEVTREELRFKNRRRVIKRKVEASGLLS